MPQGDLVIGATGDIGQALLRRLENPVGVSQSEDPDLDIESITADITDEVPDLEGYDTVYHLATLNSYGHPAPTEESPDVAGSRNLVEAIETLDDRERPDVVYVSSAAAIDAEPSSDDEIGYAEAKAAGESIIADLDGSSIVRPGSVYGDGKGAISYFLDRAEQDRPLTLYGDGTQQRSFVHIDDVADAIAEAEPGDRVEAGEDRYSLNDVANIFDEAAGIDRDYNHEKETDDVTLSGDWEQYETERSLEEYVGERLTH